MGCCSDINVCGSPGIWAGGKLVLLSLLPGLSSAGREPSSTLEDGGGLLPLWRVQELGSGLVRLLCVLEDGEAEPV